MSLASSESTVNTAFDARDGISTATKAKSVTRCDHALDLLDKGEARVRARLRAASGKQAVAEEGRAAVVAQRHERDLGRPRKASWWDKVPSKFDGWGENRFRDAGFRAVPGAIVRRSALSPEIRLMPSFVNLGAYVDESTMIDTWYGRLLRADRQACAHFRRRRHRGVLEPLQASPSSSRTIALSARAPEVAEA